MAKFTIPFGTVTVICLDYDLEFTLLKNEGKVVNIYSIILE